MKNRLYFLIYSYLYYLRWFHISYYSILLFIGPGEHCTFSLLGFHTIMFTVESLTVVTLLDGVGNLRAAVKGVGEVWVPDVSAVLVDCRARVGDEEHTAHTKSGKKIKSHELNKDNHDNKKDLASVPRFVNFN